MEIIGYSERGVMNALFYGIALLNDESESNAAMNEFLSLCGFKDKFSDYKLYMEFSLSDFGSPDLVFTAKNKNNEFMTFFVEAKVSAGNKYSIVTESDLNRIRNNTSNLFFQIIEKCTLMEHKDTVRTCPVELLRPRKLGNNGVVNKFFDAITNTSKQYYIAIIPQQEETKRKIDIPKLDENSPSGHHKLNIVYWEDILNNEILGPYIEKTMDYNVGYNNDDQIRNRASNKRTNRVQ